MRLTGRTTIFSLCLSLSLVSSITARMQLARQPHIASSSVHKRTEPHYIDARNVTLREDPAEMVKRDGTKYVFMHHIVGNTYPYTIADWKLDVAEILAKGVDAIALNIGSDSWQLARIQDAYDAAVGTNLKLFISFDYTAFPCSVSSTISYVQKFSSHSNQFLVNGKPMISSYSGDCLGTDGWKNVKSSTNGYLMPFIWGIESTMGTDWSFLDSWYCWGCAWPQGNYAKNTDDDNYYIGLLGTRYATTVSMWMYTHLSDKNFYLRGDDWLINNRWEQLVEMRDKLTFVEMVTWNDYGESDYFGPFRGAQPAGTFWAENFPHTAWYDMSEYYITAFKTGAYPKITKDVIYFWARPHLKGATATSDSLGKPTGWDWTSDNLWAAVFATSSATVTLKVGSSSQTFSVTAGVNKLSIPLAVGSATVQMVRSSQTIINYTPTGYACVASPSKYNYNAWVGAATATATATSSSSSATSSAASTSAASSMATSASSTATSATASSTAFTALGCVAEGTTGSRRALTGASYTKSGMTPAVCQALCSAYTYAGVEYGNECYCGNSLTNNGATGAVVSSSYCTSACDGDSSQKCGGGYYLNVYVHSTTSASSSAASSASASASSTASAATTTSTGFSALGCVAEGTTGSRRALTGASYTKSTMTPAVCQSLCSAYTYAGVEYGNECYCGNSLTNNGATGAVVAASNCASACAGDSSQKCGGGYYMNVYSKAAWTSQGCYIDTDPRILRGSFTDASGMTTEKCIGICSAAGYTIAGTEYGTQCLCGSTLYSSSTTGIATTASQCSKKCDGDSTETCGEGWRMNLYTAPGKTL